MIKREEMNEKEIRDWYVSRHGLDANDDGTKDYHVHAEFLKAWDEKRPHGKWVPGREISQMWTGNNLLAIDYEDFSCSCCGVVVEESTEPEWQFCPNCGADMRKKGEQK